MKNGTTEHTTTMDESHLDNNSQNNISKSNINENNISNNQNLPKSNNINNNTDELYDIPVGEYCILFPTNRLYFSMTLSYRATFFFFFNLMNAFIFFC